MPSKRQIDKCGDELRQWKAAGGDSTTEGWFAIQPAVLVVLEYHLSHAEPMLAVNDRLREVVTTTTPSGSPSVPRVKRLERTMEKLVKMPSTRLTQIEDLGGCRVVLPSQAEVAEVVAVLNQRWTIVRHHDYVRSPKPSGYRAIHLVAQEGGRRIEVQLRTESQHQWAHTVEVFSGRHDLRLKDEEGPPEVLEYFRLTAEIVAADEEHLDLDERWHARYEEARLSMSRWIEQEGRK